MGAFFSRSNIEHRKIFVSFRCCCWRCNEKATTWQTQRPTRRLSFHFFRNALIEHLRLSFPDKSRAPLDAEIKLNLIFYNHKNR